MDAYSFSMLIILLPDVGLGDQEIEEDLRKELAALSLVGSYKHIVSMMGASYTEGDSVAVASIVLSSYL